MVIHLDFSSIGRKSVIACILRGNKKNQITYNSKLIYFNHPEARDDFIQGITKEVPEIQIYHIDVYGGNNPPPEDKPQKGYWCPYCKSWEYWTRSTGGYRRCPICGISDSEYYVKKYNRQLWVSNMKTKKDKKYEDKMKKKGREKK